MNLGRAPWNSFYSGIPDYTHSSETSDTMLLDTDSLGNIYSPLKGLEDPISSPPQAKVSIKDRKVEVPLSPPRSEQRPPWDKKSASFGDVLPKLITNLPPPIPEAETAVSDDVDTFIKEVIAPIGIKAERSIEQEQLREADTTKRVAVPIMDFSLPDAPWNTASRLLKAGDTKATYKSILTDMKNLHFERHIWPMSGKAERELQWTPFPAALGKVDTKESINDDGSADEYILQPECIDAESLTWKPEGIRLFDEFADLDEDKLEEGIFPEGNDMESLIRKRKLEIDFEDDNLEISEQHWVSRVRNDNRVTKSSTLVVQEKQNNRIPRTLLGGSFSPLGSLDSYMDVRQGKVRRLEEPVDHETAVKPFAAPAAAPVYIDSPKSPAASSSKDSTPNRFLSLLPPITVPSSVCLFVVSTSFLGNRKLSRCIQRLFPSAEFIERDFALHSATEQITPSIGFELAQTSLNTMADEADMILSPGTGLLWTTLQRIKQRSLPGQAVRSAIRDRIVRSQV